MLVHQDIPNHGFMDMPEAVQFVLDEDDYEAFFGEHPEMRDLVVVNRFTPGNPENKAVMKDIDERLLDIRESIGECAVCICMFPPEDSMNHQPAFYVYGPDSKAA